MSVDLIELQSATVRFGSKVALTDVNLRVARGDRIALVGANGAGKSTLAKLLLGLYSPTSGRITVNGTDLNEIDPSALVKKGVVPENLANSVLTNDDLGPDSLQYGTLTSKGQQLWEDGYSNFLAGGGS